PTGGERPAGEAKREFGGRQIRREPNQRAQRGVDEQRIQWCRLVSKLLAVDRRVRRGRHMLSPINERPFISALSHAQVAWGNDLAFDDRPEPGRRTGRRTHRGYV